MLLVLGAASSHCTRACPLTLPPLCPRSNTYSVCNALAGHYNSFGNEAPVPKKRLERLVKVRGCRAAVTAVGLEDVGQAACAAYCRASATSFQ